MASKKNRNLAVVKMVAFLYRFVLIYWLLLALLGDISSVESRAVLMVDAYYTPVTWNPSESLTDRRDVSHSVVSRPPPWTNSDLSHWKIGKRLFLVTFEKTNQLSLLMDAKETLRQGRQLYKTKSLLVNRIVAPIIFLRQISFRW